MEWHVRLGHIGLRSLHKAVTKEAIQGVNFNSQRRFTCDVSISAGVQWILLNIKTKSSSISKIPGLSLKLIVEKSKNTSNK